MFGRQCKAIKDFGCCNLAVPDIRMLRHQRQSTFGTIAADQNRCLPGRPGQQLRLLEPEVLALENHQAVAANQSRQYL